MNRYQLDRTVNTLHGVSAKSIERHLGYLLETQKSEWDGRPVVMLMVGRSAQDFFPELEPLYKDAGIRARSVAAEQSDAAERRITVLDGALNNPDEILCFFDNTIRGGRSMAAAIRDVFSAYDTGIRFHGACTMTIKDELGIAHYPLAVVMPSQFDNLDKFLRSPEGREAKTAIGRASLKARRKLMMPLPPGRENRYIRLYRDGMPPTGVTTLTDKDLADVVARAHEDALGPEVRVLQ